MAKQKNVTVKEKEYTLQSVKPAEWLDIMDSWEDENGKKSRRKIYETVLENIVVQPKISLGDFEDFGEVDELVQAAIRFQRG